MKLHESVKGCNNQTEWHLFSYSFFIYRAPPGNLVKNMGNMGIVLSRIWEVYGIFRQEYGRNMGKIRVHQTKANTEDKSESKFMHLNLTMF